MAEMIYEERRIVTKRGKTEEYIERFREQTTSSPESEQGEVLRLVAGLIGAPATELLAVSRFPDVAAWERAQGRLSLDQMDVVESEDVRLLRAIASRPKAVIPAEDSRAVYGYRRFWIDPSDLDDFVRYSEEGIWPRVEAQGACILGLWTLVASTVPLEIVLMTGYHGPAHWEQTRSNQPLPPGFDEQAVEQSRQMYISRYELPLRSWVQLMRNVEI